MNWRSNMMHRLTQDQLDNVSMEMLQKWKLEFMSLIGKDVPSFCGSLEEEELYIRLNDPMERLFGYPRYENFD
jgi:hypothetical protein